MTDKPKLSIVYHHGYVEITNVVNHSPIELVVYPCGYVHCTASGSFACAGTFDAKPAPKDDPKRDECKLRKATADSLLRDGDKVKIVKASGKEFLRRAGTHEKNDGEMRGTVVGNVVDTPVVEEEQGRWVEGPPE